MNKENKIKKIIENKFKMVTLIQIQLLKLCMFYFLRWI